MMKTEVSTLPEISRFFGIRITMYYDDHMPPHFHAEYAGSKALIDIEQARVIRGSLPSRQLKIVPAWTVLRCDELMENRRLTKDHEPLKQILPIA